MYESINQKNMKNLFCAVYENALKDYKRSHGNCLKDWLINEGREIFVPFLPKREVKKYIENL